MFKCNHSDMGHCLCSSGLKKKYKKVFSFFSFLNLGKTAMVLGVKVAIFNWEWGRNSALREGLKIPCPADETSRKGFY